MLQKGKRRRSNINEAKNVDILMDDPKPIFGISEQQFFNQLKNPFSIWPHNLN